MTEPTQPTIRPAGTEYFVLRAVDDKDSWMTTISGPVTAANADAAIRKAAGDEPGTYVAVPARSWNPRTLTVRTEKRVQLGDS